MDSDSSILKFYFLRLYLWNQKIPFLACCSDSPSQCWSCSFRSVWPESFTSQLSDFLNGLSVTLIVQCLKWFWTVKRQSERRHRQSRSVQKSPWRKHIFFATVYGMSSRQKRSRCQAVTWIFWRQSKSNRTGIRKQSVTMAIRKACVNGTIVGKKQFETIRISRIPTGNCRSVSIFIHDTRNNEFSVRVSMDSSNDIRRIMSFRWKPIRTLFQSINATKNDQEKITAWRCRIDNIHFMASLK